MTVSFDGQVEKSYTKLSQLTGEPAMAERRALALDPYDLIRIMPAEANCTVHTSANGGFFASGDFCEWRAEIAGIH